METETTDETAKRPLDEMAKALVREPLRRLDLASSIVHSAAGDDTCSGGLTDGLFFINDPAVLDAERKDALTEIQQALANMSPIPADIVNKIAALGTADNVSKIRGLKKEIQQDIKQAIESDNVEKSLNLSGLMQDAQHQALWADLHKGEKEIQDAFEKLYADGKITQEQMQYLRTQRERLDGLPEDSEERISGEQHFAGYQKELGIRVRDEAQKGGDSETENSAAAAVHGVEEQERLLKEIYKLHVEGQKEKEQETAKLDSEKQSVLDSLTDNAPSTAIRTQDKQKMAVVDATCDDKTPFGGKDRSSCRTVVKT